MANDGDDRDREQLSARERLRTGAVETPPPDMTWIRRGAAFLLVLGMIGVPAVGIVVLNSDPMTTTIAAVILTAFVVALVYLMARTIVRR